MLSGRPRRQIMAADGFEERGAVSARFAFRYFVLLQYARAGCSNADQATGRPRVSDPGATATTWLRASEHDRLIALAHRYDLSVSAVVRRLVLMALRDRA